MELPEYSERNVREFMKPIENAGYASLPHDNSTGKLETQLKSYLLFAFQEQSLERVMGVWYGEDLEVSNFTLSINTAIDRNPIEFVFKGKFDPKYDNPAQLSGLQIKRGDYTEFYRYDPNSKLPEPKDVYKASMKTVQKKINQVS